MRVLRPAGEGDALGSASALRPARSLSCANSGSPAAQTTENGLYVAIRYPLHGTGGHAWSEADGERLLLARRGEREPSPVPLTPVNAEAEELAEFARGVRQGTAPEVGGAEATANIAVLEAVVESIATGRAVDVPR